MGPPGGGKSFITPRFLRHLNLISIPDFDDDSLNKIFGKILGWYMELNRFKEEIIKL